MPWPRWTRLPGCNQDAQNMRASILLQQGKLEEAFPLWEEAQREIREYLGDDRLGNLCSLLQVLSDFSSE